MATHHQYHRPSQRQYHNEDERGNFPAAASPAASSSRLRYPDQQQQWNQQEQQQNDKRHPYPTQQRAPPAGVSPLDYLMKQGESYMTGMQSSEEQRGGESSSASSLRPQLHSGKSHIYEKAFALSRSTSVRRRPSKEVDPEQDDDDDDETGGVDEAAGSNPQRHNSINLLGRFGQSSPIASSPRASPVVDDGPGPQRFQSQSSPQPHLQRRPSGDLLGNAFRSSMASDASFNTITGQQDRESIMFGGTNAPVQPSLFRRDSVDTVRSSEFDEGGRWGRAWSGKAEDEESLYGGSEWGSNDAEMDPSPQWVSAAMQARDVVDDENGLRSPVTPGVSGGSLDALRKLTQGHGLEGLTLSDGPGARTGQYEYHEGQRHDERAPPVGLDAGHLRPSAGRERIVSLTPSIHGLAKDYPSEQRSSVRDSTSTIGPSDYSKRASTDSVSTIGAGQMGDRGAAHVVVWPPTPAGSEISHGPSELLARTVAPDAASIHEWEAVSDDEDDEETSQKARRDGPAQSGSTSAAPTQSPNNGPATISSMLAQGQAPTSSAESRDTRRISSDASGSRKGGHPTGRAPPPPPLVGRYEDPNAAVPRGGLGRARAAAVAAAGRESIVSDLDVETLRLDSASRRDSSSTMRSRMSVGTVRYDDLDLDGNASASRPSSQYSVMASPISSPSQRSFSQGSTSGDGTPLASAQRMARNASQPSYPSPRPSGQNGSTASQMQRSAMANNSSIRPHPMSPPGAMKPQASQSSMRTMNSTGSTSTMTASGRSVSTTGQDTKTGPTSAENYLTQGISYHEQGDLSRSAYYFERSAKVDGGCVVGMCMWGMTLREGWGARKDPRKGFEWIQRAAAKAGEMMQSTNSVRKSEAELKAIRSELKLSVYELGKCYCYGWGIKMDKRMALDYFELAAKLGDADAQAEAGALYAAGKGCKKDLKKAAKYYRMAAAQGYDLIGLSWVWKPKFDD